MLTDHMTFPDDETLQRVFGQRTPVSTKQFSGFGRISVRPSDMFINERRLGGILVQVSSRELDHFYGRFLDILPEQTPQRSQANPIVALVHPIQGVSWAPAKHFEQIVQGLDRKCHFVAMTDNPINFQHRSHPRHEETFIGGMHGHECHFSCVVPHPNDLIVAVLKGADFIASLSTFEDHASRARVYHKAGGYRLAAVSEEVLSPSYALHLPHIEVDKLFWFVDGSALDSMPASAAMGTQEQSPIEWEEHEVEECKAEGNGGSASETQSS